MDALRLAATTVGNMGLSAGDVAAGKGCPASVGGSCGNTTYYDLFGFAVEECVVRCGITVLYWRCGPGLTVQLWLLFPHRGSPMQHEGQHRHYRDGLACMLRLLALLRQVPEPSGGRGGHQPRRHDHRHPLCGARARYDPWPMVDVYCVSCAVHTARARAFDTCNDVT